MNELGSPDIEIQDEGTIALLHPRSESGAKWLKEHVITEDTQTWGQAVACEPRYLPALIEGAQQDGLRVVP